jgi:hypothetical protein
MRHILIALATSSLLALVGCGSDDASPVQPAGPSPVTGSLGAAAVGPWKADTTLTVNAGPFKVYPRLVVLDTIHADSTFRAALYLENVLNNNVQGAVYVRSGRWTAPGDSLLILSGTLCLQADTAFVSTFGMALPFRTDASNNFIANPLKDVVCGAPDTVRTRPLTNGHWAVPMKVNMTGLASGSWVLDFERLP